MEMFAPCSTRASSPGPSVLTSRTITLSLPFAPTHSLARWGCMFQRQVRFEAEVGTARRVGLAVHVTWHRHSRLPRHWGFRTGSTIVPVRIREERVADERHRCEAIARYCIEEEARVPLTVGAR
jgi:hypothetical protein